MAAPAPSTGGAAPGYVDDRTCAKCHRQIWDSYQEVGMARSFASPAQAEVIEDFSKSTFFHRPSQRHYEMIRRGGELFLRRFQLDGEGEPIHLLEQRVDWILGSGHTSRSYLYQTPDGQLFELPLAWYSQPGAWGMAPGYDRPDHAGFGRKVERPCMFCHNAFPTVPQGSDAQGLEAQFPRELPQGLGCQRCHGPGARHVLLGEGLGTEEQTRAAIVNPAKLDPRRRDDVCYQCHFQPTSPSAACGASTAPTTPCVPVRG